jgi:hypothetical protein
MGLSKTCSLTNSLINRSCINSDYIIHLKFLYSNKKPVSPTRYFKRKWRPDLLCIQATCMMCYVSERRLRQSVSRRYLVTGVRYTSTTYVHYGDGLNNIYSITKRQLSSV